MKFVYKSILALICLSLFLFSTKNKKKSKPKAIKNTIFAHRGLPHLAENSQEGFSESKALGFTALETDVNFTKDNQLVLFHDKNLKKQLGIDKDINEVFWKDIEQLKIRHKGEVTSNNVIRLEDFLIENYGFNTVYLDFKVTSKSIADSLLSLMEKYEDHEHYLIADANILFLAYLKYRNPKTQTVLEGFNKGKEWTYYLIPERFKPNYWASFYSEIDENHISFLKNKNLLEIKIVYGIDKNNIQDAKLKGLKHLIVDYHPSIKSLFEY